MVAAYLRGLLKPTAHYGLRSLMAETAVLEAVAADVSADTFRLHAQLDAATLSVLNEKGIRSTVRSMGARAARCSELRLMDIYRLENKAADAERREKNKNTLSLYQLYHLASKNGIFDALRAKLADTDPE
jgi:hypothetical protein